MLFFFSETFKVKRIIYLIILLARLGSARLASAFFTRLGLRLSDIVVTRLDTPKDKSLIFYFSGSRLIVCTRVQRVPHVADPMLR